MKNLCFWIFFMSSLYIQISDSLGVLSLRLIAYSNPDGKTSDGNCCEHIFPIFGCASGDCDPSLQICIQDNTQTGSCSNIQYKAGPYDNTASITFGSKVGALENPIQLPFQVWKKQFVVSIAVYDDDTDGGHDHIGTITFNPNNAPGYNGSNTAYTQDFVGGYARLSILYDVHCLENYYGEDCTIFCQPDKIHYVCDAQGSKLCQQGWTGNDCLTSINDCHLSACFNSGTCEDLHNAYRCHCLKDFTGDRCEIRIPKEPTVQQTRFPFHLEKMTQVTDIIYTSPREAIVTEIAIMTDYSSQPQTLDPLNLSLSQETTSFPTEEFKSVKTDTEISSTNPEEITAMETNEPTAPPDMTTEIEVRTSPDLEIEYISKSKNESQEGNFYNTVTNNAFFQESTSEQHFEMSTVGDNDASSTLVQVNLTNEIPYIMNSTDPNEHDITTETSNVVSFNESVISSEIIATKETSSIESEFTGLNFLSTPVPSTELEKGHTFKTNTNDLGYRKTETYGKEEHKERPTETYSTSFGQETFTNQIGTENSQVSGDSRSPSTTFSLEALSTSTTYDNSADNTVTNAWPVETEETNNEITPNVPAMSTESDVSSTTDVKNPQDTTFDTEGTRRTRKLSSENTETSNVFYLSTASPEDNYTKENEFTSYSQENFKDTDNSSNVMDSTTKTTTGMYVSTEMPYTFDNTPGIKSTLETEPRSIRHSTEDFDKVSALNLDNSQPSTTYKTQTHVTDNENLASDASTLETTLSSSNNTGQWSVGSTPNRNTFSETTDLSTSTSGAVQASSATDIMKLSTSASKREESTHYDTDVHLITGDLTTETDNKRSTSDTTERILNANISVSTLEILTDNESKPNLVTTTKGANMSQSSSSSTISKDACQSRFFIDAIEELVIEVKSLYEFPAVKKEMLDILKEYGVSQTEAKFNYTVYSSVYSVWMKFDSRSVPLKMSDISDISTKVCKSLQYYRSGNANKGMDKGLGSGSLAAIIVSMLYLAFLFIIAIFLIHRKYKERNKVGSTPEISENPCISKAPLKTNLEAESNC